MTSVSELFPKCNKLAYDARQQLLLIQQQQRQQGTTRTVAASDLFMVLEELDRQLNVMEEELVLRESPAQREKWKRKIRDLRQVSASLREQGQAADYHRQQQSTYHSEREELLRRRGRNKDNKNSNESDFHNLASEGESLQSSHRIVDSLIDQGSANLDSLVRQRQQLRGVRGVLNEIGNKLGLTQSTMRIIERRDITDAYFVAAGMVVTGLVFYFVWF